MPSLDPLTERDRELYLEGLRAGLTMGRAAKAAGRSVSSFRNLEKRDEEFSRLVRVAYHEDGRDALLERLDAIIEKLVEVDPRAAQTGLFFLIKQRDPSFRENAELTLAGAGGGPVVFRLESAFGVPSDPGSGRRAVSGDSEAGRVGGGVGRPALEAGVGVRGDSVGEDSGGVAVVGADGASSSV